MAANSKDALISGCVVFLQFMMRIACRPILALAFTLPLLAQSGPPRAIHADFTQIKGPMSQVFKECIAAGRANEGLRDAPV